MKRVVSLGIIISMLAFPVAVLAQEEAGDACVQAQIDAERDVNDILWLGAGFLSACLLSPLIGLGAVGVAYLAEPSPRAMSLVGKSSEYVAAYTDCYEDKGSKIQVNKSLVGCLIGSLAHAAILFLLLY